MNTSATGNPLPALLGISAERQVQFGMFDECLESRQQQHTPSWVDVLVYVSALSSFVSLSGDCVAVDGERLHEKLRRSLEHN
ncbi:hypothetical protein RUM44_006325 [Polyplax serrata]|uniref:Uncharacterized protein n=1 Tax=Polyplax serrata TaxID=468196 RepID=A0ABR1AHT5_POLSC